MSAFVLGVGASGPQAELRVRDGLAHIATLPSVRLVSQSGLYENPAIGGVTTARFVNACCVVETPLHARALLDALRAVETRTGRVRGPKDGARALDLDVAFALDAAAPLVAPDVPHPRALQRDFVVIPALEALTRAGRAPPPGLAEAARRFGFGGTLVALP